MEIEKSDGNDNNLLLYTTLKTMLNVSHCFLKHTSVLPSVTLYMGLV